MIDGSPPFQEHIKKWTKNTKKCPKQGDDNMCYLLQGMMEYTHNPLKKANKANKLQNIP